MFEVEGVGVSDVLMKVPGMGYVTASPGWTRESQPKGWDEPGTGGDDEKKVEEGALEMVKGEPPITKDAPAVGF